MKIWREVWDYAKMIVVVLIIVMFVNNVVLINAKIPSESMEKTIMTGDRIFGFRLAYGLNISLFGHEISKKVKDPERFDIIVFPFQYQTNTYYIKRIIGLPGETVQIMEDGSIYINGEKMEESYGREVIQPETIGRAAEPIVLGEDEYFVMGDNRNNSSDSRTDIVGNIKREDIIGKAWLRIWPLSDFGVLKHQ